MIPRLLFHIPPPGPAMKRTLAWIVFLCAISLLSTAHAQIDFGLAEGVVESRVDPNPWTGTFAAGLNGKSGNSQNLDLNMAMNLARETEANTTTLLATYFYSTTEIATVTDRFFAQARRERKLSNPRWSIYFQTAYEWDRFKLFDYRIALHAGFAFEVFKEEDRLLNFRFGSGASKEVGGANEQWLPELQLGVDWERQLTDTVKIFLTSDFYPNYQDFSDYRLNTNAGVEFVVDADRDINFRVFTFNRYDSTPEAGNVENDIDYGMALSVGF